MKKKNPLQKDHISYDSASVMFSKQLKYGDGKPLLVRGRKKQVSVAIQDSHRKIFQVMEALGLGCGSGCTKLSM